MVSQNLTLRELHSSCRVRVIQCGLLMKHHPILPIVVALVFSLAAAATDVLTDAQTIPYCQLIQNPRAFDGKLVRVRALYETELREDCPDRPRLHHSSTDDLGGFRA